MRHLPPAARRRERSFTACGDYEFSLPRMPRAGSSTEKARSRAPGNDLQWKREASGRLLLEEQGGSTALEVWNGASGTGSPGFRPDRSGEPGQGGYADELPALPPAALIASARSAGEGPGQQHGILFDLPQRTKKAQAKQVG